MSGRGTATALLAGLAVLCVFGVGIAPVAGSDAGAFDVSVTVDEQSVWVDETVDITITVSNDGQNPRRLTDLTIEDDAGDVRATAGPEQSRFSPGEQTTVVVENVPVERGVNDLTVVAEHTFGGRSAEDTTDVEVVARDPTPALDLDVTAGSTLADRALALSVGNPNDDEITRVRAVVEQPRNSSLAVQDRTASVPLVEPGETRTVEFGLGGAAPGRYQVPVRLSFVTADGERWERERTLPVTVTDPGSTVEPALAPVQLDLSARQGFIATERTLSLSVGNPQDSDITRVEATLDEPPNASFRVVDRTGILPVVASGTTREVSFGVRDAPAGEFEFPVTVSYETATGESVEVTERLTVVFSEPVSSVDPSLSPIQITNLVVTNSGTTVTVQGEVSNTRGRAISGVAVGIPDREGVSPVGTGEFFVGSLDGGTFNSFEAVRADVASDRETVPVELTYSVNDTQYRTVTEVPVTREQTGGTDGAGQGGPVPEFDPGSADGTTDSTGSSLDGQVLLVVAVLLVVVAGVAVVVRRRR